MAGYLFLGYIVKKIVGIVPAALLVLSTENRQTEHPGSTEMYVTVRTHFRAEARNPSPVGWAKPAVHDFKTCHHSKDYLILLLFHVLLLDNVTNTHTDSLL